MGGVCQHSYEVAQKAEVCEGLHLVLHAALGVIEPPCASLLDLGNCRTFVEAVEHSVDDLVIVRV